MSESRSQTILNARDVAFAIRQIASERNLLRLGGSFSPDANPDVYQQSVTAFSEEVTDSFERQAVTAVGFNTKKNIVFVYTNKKVPKSQEKSLPFNVSGSVKIVYKQLKPLTITDTAAFDVVGAEPYSLYREHYACGSSISPGNARMAGTLGAIVEDSEGLRYGLTNNHVTGGCNNTRVNLPIVAPGIMDVQVGFHDPFTAGWHHAVLPMRQGDPSSLISGVNTLAENTDAALFRLDPKARLSSHQGSFYATPTAVADPEEDMLVEKVGRTTGHTKGIIEAEVAGSLPVNYKVTAWHSPHESTSFQGQVFFEPVFLIRGEAGPFSTNGDSGSLVVTQEVDGKRSAIGLIFAGREPDTSYMLPLRRILDGFAVRLVG